METKKAIKKSAEHWRSLAAEELALAQAAEREEERILHIRLARDYVWLADMTAKSEEAGVD